MRRRRASATVGPTETDDGDRTLDPLGGTALGAAEIKDASLVVCMVKVVNDTTRIHERFEHESQACRPIASFGLVFACFRAHRLLADDGRPRSPCVWRWCWQLPFSRARAR